MISHKQNNGVQRSNHLDTTLVAMQNLEGFPHVQTLHHIVSYQIPSE